MGQPQPFSECLGSNPGFTPNSTSLYRRRLGGRQAEADAAALLLRICRPKLGSQSWLQPGQASAGYCRHLGDQPIDGNHMSLKFLSLPITAYLSPLLDIIQICKSYS